MSALCGAHHPLESSHGCYEDAGDHTVHVSCTVALGGWHDELTWTVVGHDWAQQHDGTLHVVVFGEDERGPWHVARAGQMVHLSCPGGSVLEDCGTDIDAAERLAEIIVGTSDKHGAGEMRFRVTWDVPWRSCRECKDGNNYDSIRTNDGRVQVCGWCGGLTEVPDTRTLRLRREDPTS